MTPDEIRSELRMLDARKQHLDELLNKNSCGYPWRSDGTCSYCGSMSVGDAIRKLTAPGNSYSAADWKYGWPHKFYLGGSYPHKFYNKHLLDATQDELREFTALSVKYFGVAWATSSGKLTYSVVADPASYGTTRGEAH